MSDSTTNPKTTAGYNPDDEAGKTPATTPGQESPQSTKAAEEAGEGLDDLGYEVTPEERPPVEEEKPKVSEEDKGDEGEPIAGYGDEPPATEEPPKEEEVEPEKVVDKDDVVPAKDELLLPEELDSLREFIKANKVPKDLAKALVENKREEVKKIEEYRKTEEAKQKQQETEVRKAWHKELKDDATFGGEKFAHNVKRADKVISDFLPNLKNKLTETKAMVPPYVMRDLVKLADHLYGTEKLVQGDPTKPKEEVDADDPLAFYNS